MGDGRDPPIIIIFFAPLRNQICTAYHQMTKIGISYMFSYFLVVYGGRVILNLSD